MDASTLPPEKSRHCLERCDNDRPEGHADKYLLNCTSLHAGDENEQEKCKSTCITCPDSICDAEKDPHLFHCPRMKLDEHCVTRCNLKRPPSGSAYQLNCYNAYDNSIDRETCETECTEMCSFICKKHDKTEVYHCPSGSPGPTITEISWFITTLVILIPALILVTIIIWKCIYKSRNGDLDHDDAHGRGQSYQEQLPQDPYLYISPNGNVEPLLTLTSEETIMPVMISSIASHDNQPTVPVSNDDSLSLMTLTSKKDIVKK